MTTISIVHFDRWNKEHRNGVVPIVHNFSNKNYTKEQIHFVIYGETDNEHQFRALAIVNKKIVGTGLINLITDGTRATAYINCLAKNKGCRTRGIRKKVLSTLLKEARRFAKKRDFKKIYVMATANPERTELISILEKAGFIRIACADGSNGTNMYQKITAPQ